MERFPDLETSSEASSVWDSKPDTGIWSPEADPIETRRIARAERRAQREEKHAALDQRMAFQKERRADSALPGVGPGLAAMHSEPASFDAWRAEASSRLEARDVEDAVKNPPSFAEPEPGLEPRVHPEAPEAKWKKKARAAEAKEGQLESRWERNAASKWDSGHQGDGKDVKGEHEEYFEPNPVLKKLNIPERTKFYSDDERAARQVGAKDGLLTRADGSLMDTGASHATNRKGAEGGKNVFALELGDEGPGMFAADAGRENLQSYNAAVAGEAGLAEVTHHSSFTSGGAVNGAGEMKVKEGWLKSISNESGHYMPGVESSVQTLDALAKMGVNTDATKVDHLSGANGEKKDTYMARGVAESRGDLGLLDVHKDAFAQIAGGPTSKRGQALMAKLRAGRTQEENDQIDGKTEGVAGKVQPAPAAKPEVAATLEEPKIGLEVDQQLGESAAKGSGGFDAWRATAQQRLQVGDVHKGTGEVNDDLKKFDLDTLRKTKVKDRSDPMASGFHREEDGEEKTIVPPTKVVPQTPVSNSSYNSTSSLSLYGSTNFGMDMGANDSEDDSSSEEDEEPVNPTAEPGYRRGGWAKDSQFDSEWQQVPANSKLEQAQYDKQRTDEALGIKYDDRLNDAERKTKGDEHEAALDHDRAGTKKDFRITNSTYFDEHQQYFKPGSSKAERTKYYDAEERAAHEVGAKDGLLTRADGTLMDTTGAGTTELKDSAASRNIFTLDHDKKQGQKLYAADAVAETEASAKAHEAGDSSYAEHVHHSSFTAGGPVHGAGELGVKEGYLQTLSNHSGHFEPDMRSSVQTLDALGRMGVNTDATVVDHVDVDENKNAKHTDYMARAVAATRGDRGLMDTHKAAFEGVRSAPELKKLAPKILEARGDAEVKRATIQKLGRAL